MKKILLLALSVFLLIACFMGCATQPTAAPETEVPSSEPAAEPAVEETSEGPAVQEPAAGNDQIFSISGEMVLGDYQPKKTEYNFYLTYKLIHPWWDSIEIGLKEAQAQYAERGITINYEFTAPVMPDAADQVSRIETAAGRGFDVIGVDVADIKIVTPAINNLVDNGIKVMTFSSSDATKEDGCKRIAYVGNTHNYQDGADLAEILAKEIDYKGQVAALGGTIGAPCHEDRIKGFQDTMAKYPDIEVVEIQYDNDQIEQAVVYTEGFLQKYPDLKGIFCNNMGNPIGAAQAVIDAGREGEIVLVGMDHDQRAIEYLRDGVITALGIQDCPMMGFDTIQVAIMIADGVFPGDGTYPEKTEEKTTIVYQDQAQEMLDLLYGG